MAKMCFHHAPDLSQKDEVHKVTILVYCMRDTVDVLLALALSDDKNKTSNTQWRAHFKSIPMNAEE